MMRSPRKLTAVVTRALTTVGLGVGLGASVWPIAAGHRALAAPAEVTPPPVPAAAAPRPTEPAAPPRLASAAATAAPSSASSPGGASGWLGEELPLPLVVKTPQDLALKAVAERQYLVFNLLARGKLAWDAGDFATAASKWEALLRIPGIDPELERVVRPLAGEARTRAGGGTAATPPEAVPAEAGAAPSATAAPSGGVTPLVSVSGQVSGGGQVGPGGTVIWLKRQNGPTPRPTPVRGKTIGQVNKSFVPRILPVTVGSTVSFANQDPIFHNVFSLSRPNDFDSGLYKAGQSFTKTFSKAGPVQILCNIHASMLGYVVVVDSPWYGQADGRGSFTIRGVPPGDYDLEAWHEASSKIIRSKLSVGSEGVRGVTVRVSGDKRAPSTVPDKYGKDRQVQLGY